LRTCVNSNDSEGWTAAPSDGVNPAALDKVNTTDRFSAPSDKKKTGGATNSHPVCLRGFN